MSMGRAVTISWSAINVAGTVTIGLYHATGRVCADASDGSGREVCTESRTDQHTLVSTPAASVNSALRTFTWAIPSLFSTTWGVEDSLRSDFYFRITADANPTISAETSHDLNLRQEATSLTSSTVVASRGTGYVLTSGSGGCTCRSSCRGGGVTAVLAGGSICRVDANCTDRWGTDYLLHRDWVGRCSVGLQATVPTTANRTRPVPMSFTARVTGGDIASWSVRLAR